VYGCACVPVLQVAFSSKNERNWKICHTPYAGSTEQRFCVWITRPLIRALISFLGSSLLLSARTSTVGDRCSYGCDLCVRVFVQYECSYAVLQYSTRTHTRTLNVLALQRVVTIRDGCSYTMQYSYRYNYLYSYRSCFFGSFSMACSDGFSKVGFDSWYFWFRDKILCSYSSYCKASRRDLLVLVPRLCVDRNYSQRDLIQYRSYTIQYEYSYSYCMSTVGD